MADSLRESRRADCPETSLLFVYGHLKTGIYVPRSVRKRWPDRVRARLYDLGPYPAAVDVGKAEEWIEGLVLELHTTELKEIDEYEMVDEGQYRRIRTVTEQGWWVWVYEYARPIPAHARGPLPRWPCE